MEQGVMQALMLARLVLWGFLAWGVWLGSRLVLVVTLVLVFAGLELALRVTPASRSGQHRRSSDSGH